MVSAAHTESCSTCRMSEVLHSGTQRQVRMHMAKAWNASGAAHTTAVQGVLHRVWCIEPSRCQVRNAFICADIDTWARLEVSTVDSRHTYRR